MDWLGAKAYTGTCTELTSVEARLKPFTTALSAPLPSQDPGAPSATLTLWFINSPIHACTVPPCNFPRKQCPG